MNIDRSKLKIGIWYEDDEGNVYKQEGDCIEAPNDKCTTYHTLFPGKITEEISSYYSQKTKNNCKHPRKARSYQRRGKFPRSYKNCVCLECRKEKLGKWYRPFFTMEWDDGRRIIPQYNINTSTSLSGTTQECVINMTKDGYTLDEALSVYAFACERCTNALIYKYTDGKDGYPEDSDEYRKCNTECEYCNGTIKKEGVVE